LLQAGDSRAVLLSIKPKYSSLIVSGEKRVEFRRKWAAGKVGLIAVYASAPVQRIVALVNVEEVVLAPPRELKNHCVDRGGALTPTELMKYFAGNGYGYAVLLGRVRKLERPIDPRHLFRGFSAPQSFRYLSLAEVRRLEQAAKSELS